jgi:hypothetical protein
LTSGPGASAAEGEGALTEWAQRQRTWALTGGPGRQGAWARSSILGSGPFNQDRSEGGVPGGPRRFEGVRGGSEGVQGGPRWSEPFDQDRTGEIRPGRMSGCGWR